MGEEIRVSTWNQMGFSLWVVIDHLRGRGRKRNIAMARTYEGGSLFVLHGSFNQVANTMNCWC